MPYDIVDVYADIQELKQITQFIIGTLIDKGIMPKPEEEKEAKPKVK